MYKDVLLETASNLAESRIKIAFGTDLGLLTYSVNGAVEFGEMTANGISPLRALRAATSVAAEMLMRPELGTLAPGKTADIIAVPGNPFENITVMEMVNFVIKDPLLFFLELRRTKQRRPCGGHPAINALL